MDLLRLPPPLRRSLLAQPSIQRILRQFLSTTSSPASHVSASSSPASPPSPSSPTPEPEPELLTLSSSTLNSYLVSPPPHKAQLNRASKYFTRHEPTLLYSLRYFRQLPASSIPEVAFLGRSNVGKSSLFNALLGRGGEKRKNSAHVSKRPGRTRTMNGFAVGAPLVGRALTELQKRKKPDGDLWRRLGHGGVVVMDMPGYGAASREEWGREILRYLERRPQLRRTYVLVDAEHGLKPSDRELLLHLRQSAIPHQVVLSKVDKLLAPGPRAPGPRKVDQGLRTLRELCESVRRELEEAGARGVAEGPPAAQDILCCSALKRTGIDELRWSVLTTCGLEADVDPQAAVEILRDDDDDDEHGRDRRSSAPYAPLGTAEDASSGMAAHDRSRPATVAGAEPA